MWMKFVNWLASLRSPAAHRQVTVYSRVGCHLCDEAYDLLVQHGLRPTKVDIDTDPTLRQLFSESIPVVYIDGHERFRGRVNPVLLKRLLLHPPKPPAPRPPQP